MSLAFLITAFLIVATPGTGALYTLSAGLARGSQAGVLAALASTLGIIPHLVAAMTGVAAVLHASAVGFATLKFLGVAYLLYMAVMMWRDDSPVSVGGSAPPGTWAVIRTGVLINLLNPKLSLFFFAFLPQFVPPGDPAPLVHMLGLSLVFMAMTFAVFAVYGMAAGALRRQVLDRPRLVQALRRGFAGAFAVMGLRLALADR